MTERNRLAEERWLETVRERATAAGVEHPYPATFANSVIARLDQAGPRIRVQPIHRYLHELEEEVLDVAAWGLVALEAHPRATVLRPTLRELAVLAYRGHAMLAELEEPR